jgi:hypothetical protein
MASVAATALVGLPVVAVLDRIDRQFARDGVVHRLAFRAHDIAEMDKHHGAPGLDRPCGVDLGDHHHHVAAVPTDDAEDFRRIAFWPNRPP